MYQKNDIVIIRSRRRTMSIEITPEGEVLVRAPEKLPVSRIMAFVNEKEDWINAHVIKAKARRAIVKREGGKLSAVEQKELIEQARRVLTEKVRFYAPKLGVNYGRIAIRCQKTRWGSCSSLGNLNFNYLLMLAPEEVQDYVVVHELCHRLEMNHSAEFWQLVEQILPDYKKRRAWLKKNGESLMMKVR